MDEDKFADLNDIQDFFNRSHSTSASGTFCTEQIDIKDFIEWCNDPCNNISENSPHSDQAYKLGNTVLKLNEFNDNKLKEMESALKEDRWDEWCKDNIEAPADDAVFYLVLKCRTDDQRHYHFYFDKDAVAEIDAFGPFTKGEDGKQVLDQQWHVLISLLALLDVAHALNSEHHKYHCLYPYLISYDKGDLSEGKLQLKSSLSLNVISGRDYTSEPMMTWIKDALVKPEDK